MTFYKFDGAGNDFILLDIREHDPQLTTEQIARLCHRRFGIGADGLMTLGSREGYDFEMRYYNSDGRLGSMCGNGGRCITAFAKMRGVVPRSSQEGTDHVAHFTYHFVGYDGDHSSTIISWNGSRGIVRLKMRDIEDIRPCLDGWFLDTGSPHYVQVVEGLGGYDVFGKGRALRNRTDVFPEGTNVDFIEPQPDGTLYVRTYERGVEDETYSCGTGVTASALVYGTQIICGTDQVKLYAPGGSFTVDFEAHGNGATDVFLIGSVSFNFKGEVGVDNNIS